MGCNFSDQAQLPPTPHQPSLDPSLGQSTFPNPSSSTPSPYYSQSHQNILVKLKSIMESLPTQRSIISFDFFTSIFDMIMHGKMHWETDDIDRIVAVFVAYLRVAAGGMVKEGTAKQEGVGFGEKFGREVYKIVNSVKMKNFWVLQTFAFRDTYLNKKFDLADKEQIANLFNQVKNLCSNYTPSLAYISHYLLKSCQRLQSQSVPIDQINKTLKQLVCKLKQKFSPKNTLFEQLKYNKNRSYQKDELLKIASMDVPYQKKVFVFKSEDKETEMDGFIMQMVQLGKSNFGLFTRITSEVCMQNGGFAYKSNLKLKQASQTLQLLRVKQKQLGSLISQYYKDKTFNCTTIQQLRIAQINYLKQFLAKTYKNLQTLQFNVTDILRGKCMFNKISQINTTAACLQAKITALAQGGQDIQLVSINNRLSKITNDLMLKIRMGEIVCEFQLVLKFNQAENQIHHKMYEVERAVVFSPVGVLANWWTSCAGEFFGDLAEAMGRGQGGNGFSEEIESLKKFMNYTSPKVQQQLVTKISKQDEDFIKNFKLNSLPTQTKQQISSLQKYRKIRTGICYKQLKNYSKAVELFSEYQKSYPEDIYVLTLIGEVFKKQAKYPQTQQILKRYFQKLKNLEQNGKAAQINKEGTHEAIVDFIQANYQMANFTESLDFLKNFAFDFQRKNFGQKSRQYAKMICLQARGLARSGSIKESLKKYKQSIQIFQKSQNKQDPNYPGAYCLLGEQLIAQGISSQALQLLNKAYSLTQGMFGKQSIQTANVILTMGQAYQQLLKYNQAEIHYKKYQQISQNVLTKQSRQYATSYYLLSNLYRSMNKYDQSEKALKLCESIILKLRGQNSNQYAMIKNTLGLLYLQMKKGEEALKQMNHALSIFKKLDENAQNPNIASIHGNIALALQQLGRIPQALQQFNKHKEIIGRVSGKMSVKYALCLNNIGSLLLRQSKYNQSLQYLLQSKSTFQSLKVQNNHRYLTTLSNLSLCYRNLSKNSEALELLNQICSIYEATNKNSLDYAQSLFQKYAVKMQLDSSMPNEERKAMLQEILRIYRVCGYANGIQVMQWMMVGL